MSLSQALIYAMIELCEEYGMEWHWLDEDIGIQVDLTSTDEFSRRRFIKATQKLQEHFERPY